MRNHWLIFAGIILLACNAFADEVGDKTGDKAHNEIFAKEKFPSAKECSNCHPDQYKEWSSSPHAYAQLSPVFNAMSNAIVKRTNGTTGDFCIRCHTPVGLSLGEPVAMPNAQRHQVSLEGVTCVVCHRIDKPYGKTSGRQGIVRGDLFEPVYGPTGNEELRRVIEDPEFDVNADREKSGRNIHSDAVKLPQISTSGFCGSCHDVNSAGGLRLEEAFSEYKSSPAARNKVSCQDCHMGKEAGLPNGYETKAVAIVGGKPTKPRKHANHSFVGPDYSIVHPGIFPHNVEAQELATMNEWLDFDYKAGWGTDDFEDLLDDSFQFPDRWASASDRFEAREVIDENLARLQNVAEQRKTLLQRGYQLGNVQVKQADEDGIKFRVEFKNGTDGHNVPTGFDGERVVFLRVSVKDNNGQEVFTSGDLDPNGDLRDLHSRYVHDGKLPLDDYLFSLQSKFIIRLVRGGDREQVLPVNSSVSPLPFVRPPTSSTLLLGRPRAARKHRKTIPPLASRWAEYRIGSKELAGSEGPYTAKIQIVAGMVPVNLIYEIQDVGFDYGMSPREVADAVVAGHQVLWEREVALAER